MAANDDLKAFEEQEERKWSNWERIQRNMAAREARRKKPKSNYEPPQKPKFKDTGKWQANYAKHQTKQQEEINAKYKNKKKKDAQKRAKEDSKIRNKVKNNSDIQRLHSKEKMGHGLSKAPPKTSNYAVNYRREQEKMQKRINEKYAKQKKAQSDITNVKKNEIMESKTKENNEEKSDDKKKVKKKKKLDPEAAEKKRIALIAIGPNDTPIKSVQNDEFDKIKRYAMSYASDLNQKDKLKNTVLHHCAKLGKYEMMAFLIKHVSKTIVNVQNFVCFKFVLLFVLFLQ